MTLGFDLTVNLALIFTIGSALVALVVRRFRAVEARIEHAELKSGAACEKALGMCTEHDKRLGMIESHVPGLPKANDLHSLQLTIAEVRGDLREMRAVMDGNARMMGRLETIVQRQEEHLLSSK